MKTLNRTAMIQVQAFASQLIPAIVGVGAFMLLVRHAHPEVMGQFLMYMAAVVLFEMIKSGGLQSAMVMRMSGCSNEHQPVVIGSTYFLGGIISAGLSLVLFVLYLLDIFSGQPGIQVFCGWYACLGLVTLPLHVAEATAVARQDLNFLLQLRIAQSAGSLFIALFACWWGGDLKAFAAIHLLFNMFLLAGVLISGKTNPLTIRKKAAAEVKSLLGLIRYTLATLAATNALKSADTFLIGSMLGPKAVAAYAVPLKLTELFEIPLRSLSTTAFPQLAARNNQQDIAGFRAIFTQYLSWSYLLYIPALMMAFFMAPVLVTIMGGPQYAYTAPVFQVFILYGLLLPTDRLTGISLDALQQPRWNLVKVTVMAVVNIGADIAALKWTGQLEWVAFASVLNAATGAVFGLWMLRKMKVLSPANLLPDALVFIKTIFFRPTTAVKEKTAA